MNRHGALSSPTDFVEIDRPRPPLAEPVVSSDAEVDEDKDAIDRAIDAQMDALDAVMDAMIEPIQLAFDTAMRDGLTAAELIERMPKLLGKISTDELQEKLTQAAFAARLVAALGVNVGADLSAQAE